MATSQADPLSFEDLILALGGMGAFQWWLVIALTGTKLSAGWSMLQMSYAGMVPDWDCVPNGVDVEDIMSIENRTMNLCQVNNSLTNFTSMECESYHFTGISNTIRTEWDLVCDQDFVGKLVTAIQMAGVLVGAGLAGQLGVLIGRRKSLFSFVFLHIVFNVVEAFAVNWEMFAAVRFCIGSCIGGILVLSNPYPLEFLPSSSRTISPAIPWWPLGIGVLALMAYWLEDWADLHLACAVSGVPFLLVYFWVPESVRWLTVKGRLKEAKAVVDKIASVNHRDVPASAEKTLQAVYQAEEASSSKAKKYTYLDLVREWKAFKTTAVVCFCWFMMAVVYYGIMFAVSSLSGNLYLNMSLLALADIPTTTATIYTNNRFGRKSSALTMFVCTLLASVGCLLAHYLAPESSRGDVITVLAISAKVCIATAWTVMQTWSGELYPTVMRNLGVGMANTVARVGGIVAPYMVDLDANFTLSFIMMSVLLLLNILLLATLPDTKGVQLLDSIAPTTVVVVEAQKTEDQALETKSSLSEKGQLSETNTKLNGTGVFDGALKAGNGVLLPAEVQDVTGGGDKSVETQDEAQSGSGVEGILT